MKTRLLSLAVAVMASSMVSAQSFSEGFEDITTLTGNGWFMKNNSQPVGTTGWFQGNPNVIPAQAGTPTSYIGANFNNTSGAGNISNWLLTPNKTFNNGDVIKFWTRTAAESIWNDALDVRFSTAGSSTNVGSTATSLGDFTTALLQINKNKDLSYPETWTEYTITLGGLNAPTSGRVAFRYWMDNGGPAGNDSNFIGIDTFSYTAAGMATSEVGKNRLSVYPNPTSDYLKITSPLKVNYVHIFDVSGKRTVADMKDNSIDVRNLKPGVYIIRVGFNDNTASVQKFIKE